MTCLRRHSADADTPQYSLLLDVLPICYIKASDQTGTPYRRRTDMVMLISRRLFFSFSPHKSRIKISQDNFSVCFLCHPPHLLMEAKLLVEPQPRIFQGYRVLPLHLSDRRTGDKQYSLHLKDCYTQFSHFTQRVNVPKVPNSYSFLPQLFSRC